MTINNIITYCRAMTVQNGMSLSGLEVNSVLPLISIDTFNDRLRELIGSEIDEARMEEIINSSNSTLTRFKSIANDAVPLNRDKVLSVYATLLNYSGDKGKRKVTIVTDSQFHMYADGIIRPDLNKHPVARFVADTIEFLPNDIEEYDITYLRKPVAPYWDFCINSDTDQEVHMPTGYYITGVPGNLTLRSPGGITVLSNVNHLTAIQYPYYSLTSELDFDERDHASFVAKLLLRFGIKVGDDLLIQVGMQDANKPTI